MFDTLATAQTLTKAGIERAHAEAISTAVNQTSELVTRSHLDAKISALEVRLIKWTIAVGISIVGSLAALMFGIVRFLH